MLPKYKNLEYSRTPPITRVSGFPVAYNHHWCPPWGISTRSEHCKERPSPPPPVGSLRLTGHFTNQLSQDSQDLGFVQTCTIFRYS